MFHSFFFFRIFFYFTTSSAKKKTTKNRYFVRNDELEAWRELEFEKDDSKKPNRNQDFEELGEAGLKGADDGSKDKDLGTTKTAAATRAAQYPTCLDVLRPWSGLFYMFTNPEGNRIEANTQKTAFRDLVAYMVVILLSILLVSLLDLPRAFWMHVGVNSILVWMLFHFFPNVSR